MIRRLGLHHGSLLLAASWIMYYFFGPMAGILTATHIVVWFGGKEYQEWKQRGTIEWPDFITPLVFAVVSIYFMKGSI